jgi:hypothetical protein
MTPALLLSAALALGQQPPSGSPPRQPPNLPKAPADAPRGLPVTLSYVTSDDGAKISALVAYPTTQMKDVRVKNPVTGQEELRKQPTTVTEFGLHPVDEKSVKITTTDGKPVTYSEAAKQVKGGKVVAMVWSFEDKKGDPAYLKALKEDTLVFEVQPAPPPPPGGASTPPPPRKQP